MHVQHAANETKGQTQWNAVNWRQANRTVRNLRQRIFKAERHGDPRKVKSLQKLMLRSYANTLLSVCRVTQVNAGKSTPGVDKVVIKTPKARGTLVDELQTYRPWQVRPTRRVYIPKSNGKLRPLGIPTVKDRVMQARIKNVLEPQWEARFESSSFGFRPGRSAHDAISAIFQLANPQGRKQWIVDADIKGAFDNIGHAPLLKAIGTVPGHGLIKQWLKAGYVDAGLEHETSSGTPQGGIISPLLANIALHGMEEALGVRRAKSSGRIRGHRAVVRYADDFVVFCESREDAEVAKEELSAWLGERGLELSEEKTQIVHITTGFDFLGFNVRQYKVPSSQRGYRTHTKPSKASVQKIRDKLRREWQMMRGTHAGVVIARLNPIIRGWANYFRMGVSSKIFAGLDHWMFIRTCRWTKSRHNTKPWHWVKEKYWGRWNKSRRDKWVFGDKATGRYLLKFAWTKIERHILVRGNASPDDASLSRYWEDRRRKAHNLPAIRLNMARAQQWKCPVCGGHLLNGEDLQDHHVMLNRENPERDDVKNRRLVHYFCHGQIHGGHAARPRAAKELLREG
ncbi:group II intron reverse transcriptase/maturase (plasmid) [Deinococcus radiomollis]|uniref:group II intron reverse transcriptase/maturase n=1 Tax=Deinococcus radiomollis TaxID=468916 RepID=UPI00389134B3